ncbi:trypsin Inhibitor like cysteine rich domain protein [Ancylostoma caninum]|uniref:Trypsin Inhibitor like cysteine rich domain protein n=1 Tax=Ancylostoma caninum TaxID=29170 RepID=A0A368FVN1_ANCCA|nr:trypsin Inhibitor like cysteine rich domain protein [Ancylostoma caninum]
MDSPHGGSGEGSSNPDEIVPCAAMQCPEGFTCEEGRVICPFVPPCFTRPTACVPNDYISGEGLGNFGEEWSGSGSGWFLGVIEEWFEWSGSGSGDCAMNMYSATCGPLCPQDCTNDLRCLAITCTDEERCFCNPGYVLLNKDDPSFGCVLPEECPNAPVDSL